MNEYSVALLVALAVSMMANLGLVWYIRNVVKRLLFISENLSDLVELIAAYRKHLKILHSMEMYYGDETIKHLIEHTNSLMILLEEYEDIVELTEPMDITDFTDITKGIEENEEEIPPTEKDVFYGGTRESNN